MKKNKILFTILASACIGMAAGCGETKYTITTKVNSGEESYITGGGKYANGKKVSLKVYPTEGCFGTETSPAQYPRMEFTRQGQESVTDSFELTNLVDGKYYLYEFTVDNNAETGNVGTYNVICNCATRSSDEASDATATKFTVNYKVIDDDGNTIKSVSKDVKYGGVAEDITSFEGLEGILEWYKDKDLNNKYDFAQKVNANVTLYSKLEDSPKAIMEGAIRAFKNSQYLEMTLDDGSSAKVNNYNKFVSGTDAEKKSMFFDYVNAAKKRVFIIDQGFYWQNEDDAYYKADLAVDGFGLSVDKLADFEKFFKHLEVDVTNSEYKFSVEKNADGVIRTNIVVGKDAAGADIEVSCAKYTIKDASDNVLYHFYINSGKIYKTESADGKTNVINYPTTGTKVNPSATKNMYMIKLELDDSDLTEATDLKDLFDEMNSSFEGMLKIKQGQTLREVLIGNATLDSVLKKYNYEVKRESTVITSALDDINPFNNSVTITIDVTANAQVVVNAVNELSNGGFSVNTQITWDGDTYNKTADIAAGTDVLNNLDAGVANAIKAVLIKLRDLDHSTNGYDSFSVNESTGEYEFFDKDCSVPYLRVKIESGKITKVTYYDFENANVEQRNTTVTTITYN